jgi:6-phosphogluconolactonase (cycloisomerase 2 family)
MSNNKDFKVKNGIQPTVYHEAVGTVVSGSVGYNLSGASYDSKSFSVAGQETGGTGIFLKPDGTKVYICGFSGDEINEYDLSTAYDISTATFNQLFSISAQEASSRQVFFKPDGTSMYVVGVSSDTVHQYTLSTTWDISTASYASKSFSVSAQDIAPVGLSFKSDGTKMYISGSASGNNVYQYSLSTAWDVSTASYDSVSFTATGVSALRGVWLSSDGTYMYLVDGTSIDVSKATMSTAWDISTATMTSETLDVSGQDPTIYNVYGSSDGTKLYLMGSGNDTIYQYSTTITTNTLDLSTGSVFEITPTSDIQINLSNPADSGVVDSATLILHGTVTNSYDIANASFRSMFYVGLRETAPQGVTFKPDGTKMYVIGTSGDDINEYSLSSPWEVTSATFTQAYDVSSQEANPRHVFFKPDGTKMYVTGTSGDDVNEYNLATPWSIVPANVTFVQTFSVSSQDTAPRAVWFKPDGLKMYIIGVNDTVYQYTLTTAWDVSTASYDSVSFSLSSEGTAMEGMYITSDGTKMYTIVQTTIDEVFEYKFSTAWDVSTLSYTGVSFSDIPQVGSANNTTFGVTISEDGTKMYIVDGSEDVIMQFDIGGTATVYYDNSISFLGDTPPVSPNDGDTDIVTFFTKDGGTTYKALEVMNGAK